MPISRTGASSHAICTSSTRPASPAEGQMIYETDTDRLFVYSGTAWISLTNKVYFDTQFVAGAQEVYSANLTGTSDNIILKDASTNLELTYTPSVDAWWEVHLHIGIISKIDAAYHYLYGSTYLSPSPVTDNPRRESIVTQHASVDTYMSLNITSLYKLAANTAYTCTARLGSGNGGTWQHHRGGNYLHMHGRAWAR